MSGVLSITVNGQERDVAPGTTVEGLIESLNLAGRRVAVERNRTIVKREDWARTPLCEGDSLEILHFVGGG